MRKLASDQAAWPGGFNARFAADSRFPFWGTMRSPGCYVRYSRGERTFTGSTSATQLLTLSCCSTYPLTASRSRPLSARRWRPRGCRDSRLGEKRQPASTPGPTENFGVQPGRDEPREIDEGHFVEADFVLAHRPGRSAMTRVNRSVMAAPPEDLCAGRPSAASRALPR